MTSQTDFGQATVKLSKEDKDGTLHERTIPIEGYTVFEVAAALNCSEQYVYDLIWTDQLAHFRIGKNSRMIRVLPEVLRSFVKEQGGADG